MRSLLLLFACWFAIPVQAANNALIGEWHWADNAARRNFGTLVIRSSTVSWAPTDVSTMRCRAHYKVIAEPNGVTFQDQAGLEYTTSKDSQFSTFLLALSRNSCGKTQTHFRATID